MPTPVPLYPVVLNVAGCPCLVVGGGPIAARKAAGLVACGADVTVVAPDVVPEFEHMAAGGEQVPGTVTILRRRYQAGEAARFRLVITASGDKDADHRVAGDAQAAGVFVNCADDADHCTFVLPSVHRDGPVTIAVSTGGASPAMATWLRRRLGAGAGSRLGVLAGLLEEARRRVQLAGRPTNAVDWQALLDGPLPDLVRAGRLDEARVLVHQASPLAGEPGRAGGAPGTLLGPLTAGQS